MKSKRFRSLIAIAMTLAIILSAFSMLGLTATAATDSATAVKSAPDTKVFATESFTESEFSANFTKWNTASGDYSIADGVLSITEVSNTRNSAYMHNVASLNSHVSVTLLPDETTKTGAIIWLRAHEYTRSNGEIAPNGYYVQLLKSATRYDVTLHKSYEKEDGSWAHNEKIGKIASIDAGSSSDARGYCDIKVDATVEYDEQAVASVINVRVYKTNTSSTETDTASTLMNSVTIVDDEAELQSAGKVGLAALKAHTDDVQTVNIKAFSYHSTDSDIERTIYKYSASTFADNMTAFGNNTKATVNGDGTLTIAGSNNDARTAAQFTKKDALNQRVVATIKTPHYYTDDTATYIASNAYVWLRSSTITRESNGQKAAYGYYVTVVYNATSDSVNVRLWNQTLNAAGTDIVGQASMDANNGYSFGTKSSSGNVFCDVTVDASITTTGGVDYITLDIYKNDYRMKSLSYTCEDVNLQKAGKAGMSSGQAAATFSAFKATSTDAVSDAHCYIEENSAKAGVVFGQILSINPSAKYQFSVLADGDFTNEPLCFIYNGITTPVEFTPADVDANDNRYQKYTYTIDVTNATAGSNMFKGNDTANTALAPAIIGFHQTDDVTQYNFKLTNFELREINEDGTLGANLIVNGDFKMGLCGWSSNLSEKGAFTDTLVRPADAKLDVRGRINYYRDANDYNFYSMFAVENFADYLGDVNLDGTFNLRDLVRIKKELVNEADYNLYADMNADSAINAEDIAQIRKDLLAGKKL